METKAKEKGKYISRLLAFFVPALVLSAIFAYYGIAPFGEKHWRGDFYGQFIPFLSELGRKLKSGASLFHTWNTGLGSDFWSIMGYYLMSPISIAASLVKNTDIILAAGIAGILKTGLCGMSMHYYLDRHFDLGNRGKPEKVLGVVLACIYALSPFMRYAALQPMWINTAVLFPILLLGMERLVKEGEKRLYFWALAGTIFSNYYMAIAVCIFCILYFFYLLYIEGNKPFFCKKNRRSFFLFSASSLLAGCAAGALLLPQIAAIAQTEAGHIKRIVTIPKFYTLWDFVLFAFFHDKTSMGQTPDLFITLGAVLTLPLYFMQKHVAPKRKRGMAAILLFLVLACNTDSLIYLFNGFHVPNGYPVRFGYIMVFFVILCSAEVFFGMEQIPFRKILYLLGGGISVYSFCVSVHYSIWLELSSGIWFSKVLPLILFAGGIWLMGRKRKAAAVFLGILLCAESVENAIKFYPDYDMVENAASEYGKSGYNAQKWETLQPDLFCRIEDRTVFSANGGLFGGYKSISAYTSTVRESVRKMYASLGLGNGVNLYNYLGSTPVTDALLGVSYIIVENNGIAEEDIYKETERKGMFRVMEHRDSPGILYGITGEISGLDEELTGENALEYQNSCIRALTGVENVFVPLTVRGRGEEKEITLVKQNRIYLTGKKRMENIVLDGREIPEQEFLEEAVPKDSYYLDLGNYTCMIDEEESDRILSYRIKAAGTGRQGNEPACYILDKQKYREAMEHLNANPFTVTAYTDESVTGRIAMEEDGYLMTSIPYNKGWTVWVDGKKVSPQAFQNAFLCVALSAGSHDISMSYYPEGLRLGGFVSLFGFTAFLIWCNGKKIKKFFQYCVDKRK